MKLLLSFILSSCAFLQMVHAQVDTLVDVFPLAVGNEWTYKYSTMFVVFFPSDETETDSGRAVYTIIGKTTAVDSTRWQFLRRRDVIHYYRIGVRDTSYVIRDPSQFELTEKHVGQHQLYRLDGAVTDAVPFQRNHVDTAMIFRYRRVGTSDTVMFMSKRSGVPYQTHISLFTFRQGVGLVRYVYELGIFDAGYSARHELLSRIIVTAPDEAGRPSEFELSQNYPNPFNPLTTISIGVPTQADLTLTVFDVLGREVKSFVYEHVPAGAHQVVWDGKNNGGAQVAGGVYFYRLRAGSTVLTKQMLLLK